MAFPKADIVSGKSVIPVFVREFLPHGKLIYDILKNIEIESALFGELEMKGHPEKYKRYSSFHEAMDEVLGDA